MSYWPPGLTRHRTYPSDPLRAHTVSSAGIIGIGAVLTTFVILGTLVLHRNDTSAETNHWTTPLPNGPLQQPTMPAPVPVLPAPASSPPGAVITPVTSHRPSPPPRKSPPGRSSPAPVPTPTPTPLIPAAGSRIGLVTAGDPSLRVRHRNFQLRLDRIGPRSSALERADATFVVRDGLADRRCLSLEAVNFPGRFVRHQNFALYLHPWEANGRFAADATFCALPVGRAGEFALRAVNYPDRYLTARDSSVRLSRVPIGAAQRFRSAAGL